MSRHVTETKEPARCTGSLYRLFGCFPAVFVATKTRIVRGDVETVSSRDFSTNPGNSVQNTNPTECFYTNQVTFVPKTNP